MLALPGPRLLAMRQRSACRWRDASGGAGRIRVDGDCRSGGLVGAWPSPAGRARAVGGGSEICRLVAPSERHRLDTAEPEIRGSPVAVSGSWYNVAWL